MTNHLHRPSRRVRANRARSIRLVLHAALLIAALLLILGCMSQPAPRPADGVISTGETTLVEGGKSYPNVEGYATAETTGVQRWYQRTGPLDSVPVVLINGSDTPAEVWHAEFVDQILGEGFQVIRYDPRDCGRSERLPWPKGFDARSWTPDVPPPYPLTALMDDLDGLLDALAVDEAHFIGVSMGGMIAQLMAINHPDRVLSLSLLSTSPSSSFDPEVDPLSEEHLSGVGKMMETAGMDSAFSFLYGDRWITRLTEAMQVVTGASDGGGDNEALIRETEEIGGYNFMSGQGFAIASAPSRVADLPRVSAPTLVLHGTEDPWFRFSHAELLAELIPDAQLIAIEGEGHAAPRDMYNPYVRVVTDHMKHAMTWR